MRPLIIVVLTLYAVTNAYAQKKQTCMIMTTMGNIKVDLYPEKAPVTVANFLKYVDAHLYDSSSFFRSVTLKNQPNDSVRIEVIQGGNVDSLKDFAPIHLETTVHTGILHKNGTISMARSQPHSATSNFFICINDQPALDFGGKRNKDGQGFAAFGKVRKGMDVVRKIQQRYPDQGQYFQPPVIITSIRRIGN